MKKIQLREAFFRVDPIRHIVGSGAKTAYHIVVTKGDILALLGPVTMPDADATTGNDADFETAANAPVRRSRSWIERAFLALKG